MSAPVIPCAGECDAAADAIRRGVEQKSIGLRILAAFARLVPYERKRAFEGVEHAWIALDVRSLVVADHPFPGQRREIVDALVVVRPQVVARRRVEESVEAQLADDRQHGGNEIATGTGGLHQLEQQRRQVFGPVDLDRREPQRGQHGALPEARAAAATRPT
jgi:hypothetical protein